MTIKILSSAVQDLIDGYWFYEKQAEGVGVYFLDTLFSDIESLTIYAGIHPCILNTIVYYPNVSLLLFTIGLKKIPPLSILFLTAEKILHG